MQAISAWEMCSATSRDFGRFDRLYRRKAHVHHFSQYVSTEYLVEAREELLRLRDQYNELQASTPPPEAQGLLDKLVSFT